MARGGFHYLILLQSAFSKPSNDVSVVADRLELGLSGMFSEKGQ